MHLIRGVFLRPQNNASAQSDAEVQEVQEILLEAGRQMGYSDSDEETIISVSQEQDCGVEYTAIWVRFLASHRTDFSAQIFLDGSQANQCLNSWLDVSDHPLPGISSEISFHGLPAIKIIYGPFEDSRSKYVYYYYFEIQNIVFECSDEDGDPPACAEILYNVASQKLGSGVPSNPQTNNNPAPGSETISTDNELIIDQIVQNVKDPAIPLTGTAIGGLIAWLVSLSRSAPIPGNIPPPSVQDGLRHPPPSIQDGLRKPALPPEKAGAVPPPLAPPPLQPATALDVLKAAYKKLGGVKFIIKTGVGAFFFLFLLTSTVVFTLLFP